MIALIAEGMHEEGIRQLERVGIAVVLQSAPHDPQQVGALIVRSVFQVNEECLKKYPNVRIVAKLGTGLDNIDQKACARRKIAVLNAPAMNAISTAEFAVAQILNIYKNSMEIYARVRNNDLRRALYFGHELADKTAGIIGYGNVGRAIAERLAPFVAKVYIRDRYTQGNLQNGRLHFVEDQTELLRHSDIVTLAVSLNGNARMVNHEFLALLKKDCLLVNIARGALIDEPALMEFLRENSRARYFCDVVHPEPNYDLSPEQQPYRNSLLALSNVFFTPHIANLTDECQRRIAVNIAEKIIHTLGVQSA